VAIAGAIVAGTGVHPRPVPGTTVAVLFGGFVGSAADYVFLLASRLGLLSVVAVLTSLYPVTTVVLARTVLKERIGRVQLAGLVLAGTGVVLITLG
jgi:drug/metabolite transporter (DMT)-like permease